MKICQVWNCTKINREIREWGFSLYKDSSLSNWKPSQPARTFCHLCSSQVAGKACAQIMWLFLSWSRCGIFNFDFRYWPLSQDLHLYRSYTVRKEELKIWQLSHGKELANCQYITVCILYIVAYIHRYIYLYIVIHTYVTTSVYIYMYNYMYLINLQQLLLNRVLSAKHQSTMSVMS